VIEEIEYPFNTGEPFGIKSIFPDLPLSQNIYSLSIKQGLQ